MGPYPIIRLGQTVQPISQPLQTSGPSSFLTNPKGGILDDLMVTRDGETLRMVVNAACKDADFAHIAAHLPAACKLERLEDFALLVGEFGEGFAETFERGAAAEFEHDVLFGAGDYHRFANGPALQVAGGKRLRK